MLHFVVGVGGPGGFGSDGFDVPIGKEEVGFRVPGVESDGEADGEWRPAGGAGGPAVPGCSVAIGGAVGPLGSFVEKDGLGDSCDGGLGDSGGEADGLLRSGGEDVRDKCSGVVCPEVVVHDVASLSVVPGWDSGETSGEVDGVGAGEHVAFGAGE